MKQKLQPNIDHLYQE